MIAYRALADWRDSQGHGTHVTGSALGRANERGGLASLHDGLAPSAKLVFTDLVGADGEISGQLATGAHAETYYQFAYSRGARVHSDSWGGTENVYDVSLPPHPCTVDGARDCETCLRLAQSSHLDCVPLFACQCACVPFSAVHCLRLISR